MPVLELVTEINARREICFDLARSIHLHKQCMTDSNEQAIAGITSGLIGQDEEVTWQAIHFGIRQKLSSRITMFQFPCHFRDEMTRGVFRMIRHDHYLKSMPI